MPNHLMKVMVLARPHGANVMITFARRQPREGTSTQVTKCRNIIIAEASSKDKFDKRDTDAHTPSYLLGHCASGAAQSAIVVQQLDEGPRRVNSLRTDAQKTYTKRKENC